MPRFQISLRSLLLFAVSALTLIIALFAAEVSYENWSRLNKLSSLKDAIVISDRMFDATEKFSLERDIAMSMLGAPDRQMIDELRPRLTQTRRDADDAVRLTTQALAAYDFQALKELRETSRAHLRRMLEMRVQIDREIALPKELRDAKLPERWSTEVSSFVLRINELWNGFIKHFTDIDPVVTQHIRLKHFMRKLIDYTSRERSLIGQLIAEDKVPTADEVSQLLRGRGATELSWQFSRLLADQSGLYPLVSAEFGDAVSHQATLQEMIQDTFYQPNNGATAPYPITADLWFELSAQASDSLVALRDAVTRESLKYAQSLVGGSEARILAQSAVLVLAFALCILAYWIVVTRVIRPINAIVGDLVRATRGEPVEITPTNRNDEIGKLSEVLRAFHEQTLQVAHATGALNRSQTEFRAVVDHAIDGLIMTDARGVVRSFNPACERIFGYKAEEIIGKGVETLLPDPQKAIEGLVQYFNQEETASIASAHEVTAKRKDGSTFPLELSVSGFMLDGVQFFSAIARDITQRKAADHVLAQHTQALERSNKELDDFAYIASHDLKEPLRGIHNHARFLLEDNSEKLDQDSAGRLLRLVYLSQRMERLVNDLLYFSRLGRQELAVQPTDLDAVIKDVESTIEVFLEERGARIQVPSALPTIVCDKPRVTELFRNLITNAVKYNDKPNKIIEIGWLTAHKTDAGAVAHNVLYVKDNGRGIDKEFHQEIFRIFKRLQGGKDAEEGTGVGLTFVKKIVERHGGKIWLESEPGAGTTFFFTLEAQHYEHDAGNQAAA
ncbi:MAG: PAS domain S-box protein [Alphaproteobacteria bacterium]|nr:PAS domain S-box protein [Alphaproteobacteria bacterium]